MSKEKFKEFVRNNPGLVKYVNSGSMTWQKFYETYDMYGEGHPVWNEYLSPQKELVETSNKADFMNMFKNVNLDSVQESINSLQRVLGVIGDLTIKKTDDVVEEVSKPIYKHMDD